MTALPTGEMRSRIGYGQCWKCDSRGVTSRFELWTLGSFSVTPRPAQKGVVGAGSVNALQFVRSEHGR